ncbi:MAG TPA: PaaI family thioesterase, partial [Stellaceae bacterium]|nr:PaaI family thioesterase [Stellaceae bacterium]
LRAMPVFAHFGLKVTRLEPGLCDLEFPYRPDFAAANGIFMAGPVGTAGDIAAGIAGATLLPPGWTMSTIDFTVKLLAPAKGERLVAEGRTIRAGRAISVNAAEIFALDDGRRILCATLLMTASNREMPGEGRA